MAVPDKNDLGTNWLVALIEELDYPQIFIDLSKELVGYTYNSRKKAVYFITEKEAKKLSKKRIVWRRMGEMWNVSNTMSHEDRKRSRTKSRT